MNSLESSDDESPATTAVGVAVPRGKPQSSKRKMEEAVSKGIDAGRRVVVKKTTTTTTEEATIDAAPPPKVEKKKCHRCKKLLPVTKFAWSKANKDKRVGKCPPCNEKHNAERAAAAGTKERKLADATYKASSKGQATEKRYEEGEAGKARNKRYKSSAEGKAASLRKTIRKKLLRRLDPNENMIHRLVCAANGIISGRRKESPTFAKRTGFRSANHLRKWIKSTLKPGMTMANYGGKEGWQIEHRITVEAYDNTDPEDRKRCWSEANMHTMMPVENKEKSFKLLRDHADIVGKNNWPKSWNGVFPNKQQRKAFYAEVRSRQEKYAEAEAAAEKEANEAGSDEEEEFDESDDESDYDDEESDPKTFQKVMDVDDFDDEERMVR